MRLWLRPDGVLALDEHIGNSKLAASMLSQMHQWAQMVVFPNHRTIGDDELLKLPDEPHSPREDVGAHQIVPLVHKLFNVQLYRTRHVLFDHYPLLYYLQHERDSVAFQHATNIAAQFEEWLCYADPEGGDYATIIALNREDGPGDDEAVRQAGNNPPVTPGATPGTPADPSHAAALQPEHEAAKGPAANELQARIARLEKQLDEQGQWARSLEQAALRKEEELIKLQGMLAPKLESALRKRLRSLRTLFPTKRRRR
jgi:hypothetical protein